MERKEKQLREAWLNQLRRVSVELGYSPFPQPWPVLDAAFMSGVSAREFLAGLVLGEGGSFAKLLEVTSRVGAKRAVRANLRYVATRVDRWANAKTFRKPWMIEATRLHPLCDHERGLARDAAWCYGKQRSNRHWETSFGTWWPSYPCPRLYGTVDG